MYAESLNNAALIPTNAVRKQGLSSAKPKRKQVASDKPIKIRVSGIQQN
jgi:hypothetical protein